MYINKIHCSLQQDKCSAVESFSSVPGLKISFDSQIKNIFFFNSPHKHNYGPGLWIQEGNFFQIKTEKGKFVKVFKSKSESAQASLFLTFSFKLIRFLKNKFVPARSGSTF